MISTGATQDREREPFVDLTVAGNRFLPLSVGPDVVIPTVPKEAPAALGQPAFQVTALHAMQCTPIREQLFRDRAESALR